MCGPCFARTSNRFDLTLLSPEGDDEQTTCSSLAVWLKNVIVRSPREEREDDMAPAKAQQTQTLTLTHIRTGPEIRPRESRDRPEVHAQTQTQTGEVGCLVSLNGANPADGCQPQSFVHQEKNNVVYKYNEEAFLAATTAGISRPEKRELVGGNGAVANARPSCEQGDYTDYHRRDSESLAGREGRPGEECYSCEGSEPEVRPFGGVETLFEEQTPRAYLSCSRVSVAQRLEDTGFTAVEPALSTEEIADVGESIDKKDEISSSKTEDGHRRQGATHNSEDSSFEASVETGLAPVTHLGKIGVVGVGVDPPARRGDELEMSLSGTSTEKTSLAVVNHSWPPTLSERNDGHAPPYSSDELRARATEHEPVEPEQMSRDASRQDGKADHGKREDGTRTKKDTDTDTEKRKKEVDDAPKKEVEVGLLPWSAQYCTICPCSMLPVMRRQWSWRVLRD